MKTKFMPLDGWEPWVHHHRAAEAWLGSYYLLAADSQSIGGAVRGNGFGIFYVEPFALAFCLELFTKARAGYKNPSFSARDAGHRSANIIRLNATIPVFAEIANDPNLIEVIEEYDKAKDIKYGEHGMQIDGEERKQVLDTVLAIRADLESLLRQSRDRQMITNTAPCPLCGAVTSEACKVEDGDGITTRDPDKIHSVRRPLGWKNPNPYR